VADIYGIIAIAGSLGIGAIIGALIAWARDHYKIERQFRFDIIKNRLEVFGKLSNEYILLASALREFHLLVSENSQDDERKFYFICKFYYFYAKIAEEAGGFEFENRQSEEVATYLVDDIIQLFSNFNYGALSQMIDLVSSDEGKTIRFNKFKVKIDANLFSEFQKKIISEKSKLSKLAQYSKWLEEIIIFEINRAFRYWYNENPSFTFDEKLLKYLIDKNEETYIDRLILSDKSKLRKFFRVKRNYY
jgi:hypothetical protein